LHILAVVVAVVAVDDVAVVVIMAGLSWGQLHGTCTQG